MSLFNKGSKPYFLTVMHYVGGRRRKASFPTGADHAHVHILNWMTREISCKGPISLQGHQLSCWMLCSWDNWILLWSIAPTWTLMFLLLFSLTSSTQWEWAELKHGASWWWRNYCDLHDCWERVERKHSRVSRLSPVLTYTEDKSSTSLNPKPDSE